MCNRIRALVKILHKTANEIKQQVRKSVATQKYAKAKGENILLLTNNKDVLHGKQTQNNTCNRIRSWVKHNVHLRNKSLA